MKHHPIYLGLVALAGLYLATANVRGWSLWQSIATSRAFGGGHGGSSFAHK